MMLVIRIAGMVKMPKIMEETLYRINLRRKYSATILENNPENDKLLKKIRSFVAYGEIDSKALEDLIEIRGQSVDKKKIDAKKIVLGLEKKKLSELGLKPFFRLHPPRGGIESKKHFGVGKGVLGNNKESIVKLMERML